MAYISFQPRDFFNILQWTGDSGASQAQTGLGFQPDMTWIKCKNQAENHGLYDSVRGVTKNIAPNLTATESTLSGVTAFGADGFTVGASGITGYNTQNYVGWSWRAGTTSGLTGGSITPTGYSFNSTAGFSIIRYTGTGATATVPHGLGVKPKCIIIKQENGTNNWAVYSESIGADRQFLFNDTSASSANANIFANTEPTSTVFSVGNDGATGGSGSEYVAYCFASTKGFLKNGSYQGSGQSDRSGTFCYTGFAPAFVLLSYVEAGGSKLMYDDKRNTYNLHNTRLIGSGTNINATSDTMALEFHATGFKIRSTDSDLNTAAGTYWYLACAEFPVVSSNSKSGTAQ